MQTNSNQQNDSLINTRRQAGQKIVEILDDPLLGIQSNILEAIRNPAAQYIELVELQQEMREKFGLTENTPEIEKFSALLKSILQFGSVPDSSDDVSIADSSDDKSVKRQNGRFTAKSGLTVADYGIKAMREIGTEIVHVNEMEDVHNARYPGLQKTARQFGGALRKYAKRGLLVVAHGDNNFSLLNEEGVLKNTEN